MNQLGGTVILLHQVFAGSLVRGGGQPELCSQLGLVIKSQAVLAPLGQQMQVNSQPRQASLYVCNSSRFEPGEQVGLRQPVPAASNAAGLRYPMNRMQVAQASRTVFQVGFEFVGAVIETRVACQLLGPFAVKEVLGVETRLKASLEFVKQTDSTPHEACFHLVGLYRDVGIGLANADVNGSNAMADFQAHIPAGLYPVFQHGLLIGRRLAWQQQ